MGSGIFIELLRMGSEVRREVGDDLFPMISTVFFPTAFHGGSDHDLAPSVMV